MAPGHDEIKRGEEPGNLFTCYGQSQKEGRSPAIVSQQPGYDDKQSIQHIEGVTKGGSPHEHAGHPEHENPRAQCLSGKYQSNCYEQQVTEEIQGQYIIVVEPG